MMVGLVIGIRQNGWDGAKKNEYGGQSRGGLARHFSFSLLKSTFVHGDRSRPRLFRPISKKRTFVIAITSRVQPSVLIISTSTGRMCGAFDDMITQTQPRPGGAFLWCAEY
jgi:hypothetical protein